MREQRRLVEVDCDEGGFYRNSRKSIVVAHIRYNCFEMEQKVCSVESTGSSIASTRVSGVTRQEGFARLALKY